MSFWTLLSGKMGYFGVFRDLLHWNTRFILVSADRIFRTCSTWNYLTFFNFNIVYLELSFHYINVFFMFLNKLDFKTSVFCCFFNLCWQDNVPSVDNHYFCAASIIVNFCIWPQFHSTEQSLFLPLYCKFKTS